MYQVLYRKWRPQTFFDVYGQPHVTTALKNELRTGRLAHAYLFTGSRGTGKTSCAKILAKAVNCLHPVDGDPCNTCELCRGIDSGAVTDVVEIDAASNNGVDDIRDLRDEVNFTPSVAAYRVYIIDEVHMLTTQAFNALLKTLEEPPAHVLFILATTEVHKLPATILSRCQRFDFSRIRPEDIAARLHYVAEQEGFTIDDEASLLLARLADGALRDALSLLDQCLARTIEADGVRQVTVETVTQTAGLVGRETLFELSAAVRTGDSAAALSWLDRLYNASRDMEQLCNELIGYFRNLMIVKSVENPDGLIVASGAELAQLRDEATAFTLPALLHVLTVLQQALERLRGGASRRVEMELTLLRLCAPELDTGTDSLLRRMKAVENAVRAGGLPAVAEAPSTAASLPIPSAPPWPQEAPPASGEAEIPLESTAGASVPATSESAATQRKPAAPSVPAAPELPFAAWSDVMEQLAESCPPLFGVLSGSTASVRGDLLLIGAENPLFSQLVRRDGNRNLLIDAIRKTTGQTFRIGVKKAGTAPTVAPVPAASSAHAATEAAAAAPDPLSAFLRSSRALGVEVSNP